MEDYIKMEEQEGVAVHKQGDEWNLDNVENGYNTAVLLSGHRSNGMVEFVYKH